MGNQGAIDGTYTTTVKSNYTEHCVNENCNTVYIYYSCKLIPAIYFMDKKSCD